MEQNKSETGRQVARQVAGPSGVAGAAPSGGVAGAAARGGVAGAASGTVAGALSGTFGGGGAGGGVGAGAAGSSGVVIGRAAIGVVAGAPAAASDVAGVVTGGGAGAVAGPSSQSGRGKNRHCQHQIDAMEGYFKDCSNPDRMQRNELARTLGLDPAQVKFWFQNKRTQLKMQTEREENEALKSYNNVLRAENQRYMKALRSNLCLECSARANQVSLEINKLKLENIHFREELERLESHARFMANLQNLPILSENPQSLTMVPQLQNLCPVDLSLGHASTSISGLGEGRSFRESVSELVVKAAGELNEMAMAPEPFWTPCSSDGVTSVLSEGEYLAKFPNNFGPIRSGYTREASRHTARVLLNPKHLLNILMDVNEWSYMFSPIVSGAMTLDVLSVGENYSGALQVMTAEYQIPTPLVSNREAYFARYCTQLDEGEWVVVDVSLDNILPYQKIMTCQKRPSGCLIQEMDDGTSQITWVEHVHVDNGDVSTMYKCLLLSGLGFGARRWVSTLERQCQRLATAYIVANVPPTHDSNNLLISSPEGKRELLKLAERMVNSFNLGIACPKCTKWTKIHENIGDDIRLMIARVVDDPGLPTGTLLSVATSFALSVAPSMVFDFLCDHRSRKEWDIFANGNDYEPVFHISYGEEASNCVSIYKSRWGSDGHMPVLQESWSDPVASHIVFAYIESGSVDLILGGSDPNSLPILPSGFTIHPDGHSLHVDGSCGTLLSVSFQFLMDVSPIADIDMAAATNATELLRRSCQKIKHAVGAVGPNT